MTTLGGDTGDGDSISADGPVTGGFVATSYICEGPLGQIGNALPI